MIKKRNLVMGAVRGYSYELLRPFILSLQRTGFDGDVVLHWNHLSPETVATLKACGVKLVHFDYRGSGAWNSWSRFWPIIRPVVNLPIGNGLRRVIYKKVLNLAFVRYVYALEFLEANAGHYNQVLLTDVRDVIFQDDPFRDLLPDEIVVFLESSKIKYGAEALFVDPWIRENYGDIKFRQLSGQRISCCGTVMGTQDGMINYLRTFVDEIKKLRSVSHGADTSIHNVLIWQALCDHVSVVENLQGAVGTIGCNAMEELQLGGDGLVLNSTGHPIPVLHQYDRHPDLAAALIQKLADGAPPKQDSDPVF